MGSKILPHSLNLKTNEEKAESFEETYGKLFEEENNLFFFLSFEKIM